MGFNEMFDWVSQNYLELVGTGGIFWVVFNKITTTISTRKQRAELQAMLGKVLGTSDVGVKTFGEIANLIVVKFNEMNDKFQTNALAQANAQMDNVALTNAVISLMAVSNVPLQYKQDIFKILTNVSTITGDVKNVVDKILQAQVKQEVLNQDTQVQVYADLKGV